jgi:hypothetical protein
MKRRIITAGFILLLCCLAIFEIYYIDKPKEDAVSKNRVMDKQPENIQDPKEAYYNSIKDKDGFCIADGILYAYLGQEREITIPDTVTEIYGSALSGDFKHGENLVKVIVPGTVRKIDSGAFAFTAAKKIVVEEGVEEIEKWAFGDSYIEEIWFPSSLQKIGNGIMETEEGLDGTKIHVPKNSMISQYFEQAMPYGNAELDYE